MSPIKSTLVLIAFFFLINSNFAQIDWTPIGPGGGGWLTAITVVDDDDNTIFVSCDVGGIYKSTDHGATWKITNEGLTSYDISDIAYDPNATETIYAASRGGVFKSTDGGANWEIKRNGFPEEGGWYYSAPIGSIVVDHNNPQVIYAGVGIVRNGYFGLTSYYWEASATKGTVFKSTDAGENWTPFIVDSDATAMVFSIKIDPSNSNTVYATTSEGLFKSTNAGEDWTKINGLPHDLTMNIIINPTDPDILHITMWAEPGSGEWKGGVYKSTNGGNSWSALNNDLPKDIDNITNEAGLTSNYVDILADKNNPNIMYIGNPSWLNGGVFKTIDGGAHWFFVTETEGNNTNVNTGWIQDGVAVTCLAIDPSNSSRLYLGSPKVIVKTEDAGGQWEQIYTDPVGSGYWKGRGFQTTVIGDIAIDPSNSQNVYVGYWDMGFQKSIDGGASYKHFSLGMTYKENVFSLAIDPVNVETIYATTGWWNVNEGEIVKSINAGETWTPINNNLPQKQIWSLALDKNSDPDSRILYAAVFEVGLFKTLNGGETWELVNELNNDNNKEIRKIAIDPNNSDVLYAGFQYKEEAPVAYGGIFKSIDAGDTWAQLDIDLPQINVQDIAVDPNNSQIIYTAVHTQYDEALEETVYGGVFKSIDGGVTWSKMNNGFGPEEGLKVQTITVSPGNSDVLYAGTTDSPFHDNSSGRGLFKSSDGGATWTPINTGIEALYIDKFKIDPSDPKRLFVGTGGNGLMTAVDDNLVLPIEILDPLSALVRNNQVLLKWSTANEINNSGFEIQRSGKDLIFEKLDFIPSKSGTIFEKRYQVLDPFPLAQNYYRYKQIDFDGQYSYSNIVSIRLPENEFQFTPNIVIDGQLNYQLKTNAPTNGTLLIYTSNGKKITTIDLGFLPKGKTIASISIDLPAGYYYGIVKLGEVSITHEFVVD